MRTEGQYSKKGKPYQDLPEHARPLDQNPKIMAETEGMRKMKELLPKFSKH